MVKLQSFCEWEGNSMLRNIKEALHLYWRLIKTNFQIIKGTFKVMKLPHPRVTIFGLL